jgi:hypothetical protein
LRIIVLGRVKHREFAMASGEMSESQFTAFLSSVYAPLCKYSTDGSIHQICMDWRHMREMLAAGDANYSELKNVCIWNKSNAGMGTSSATQCGSNPVSGGGLPKTGIFQVSAGD